MSTPVSSTSGYVAFKPRARLLKLIGSELISDDVVAITELVKNAHDADATRVVIAFRGVTGEGGEITVMDDGHGMDRDTLLGGWMEPAGSTKTRERRLSPRGRWMLGEKGLGRFAADKLGRRLELISRRSESSAEVRASFDWDQFDDESAMLGEVKSRWELRPASVIDPHGTLLRIGGLRNRWTERMFRRLSTRLSRLRSPYADRDGFSIIIESDEFPEYSGELTSGFLDQSPYHIEARFDGSETIEVRLKGERPSTHLWSNAAPLSCGPLRVVVHAFDLETEAIARVGPRMEVRAWLKEWCGISIYRDGFRVWPYGEPHDDWLRLDQRRVNNPVICLSNNQIVGFVEISERDNPGLRDQTNREGLINSQAFDDLRRLMHYVLHFLETRRQSVRHPAERRGQGDIAASTSGGRTAAAQLRGTAARVGGRVGAELRGIASRLEEEVARQETQAQRLVDAYADLAALGLAVHAFPDELEVMLKRLGGALQTVRTSIGGVTSASAGLLTIEESVTWLRQRTALLAGMQAAGAHRRRTGDIGSELWDMKELFAPICESRGVSLEVDAPVPGLVRVDITPESLRLVVHLLISNALDWADQRNGPEVRLKGRSLGDQCELIVSDNGPGIPAQLAARIFEPRFSLKEGGRGMGLTLARHLVQLHGGTIDLDMDRRRRGAHLRIVLPRKRARATRLG